MTHRHVAALIASLLASHLCPGAFAQPAETIDKQITIYAAGTAGGGVDLFGRLLGRHLGRHIPGQPAVVVQDMPGAGGIRAANFMAEQAPRDGTALAIFPGGPILEPLIGARNPGYDMSQFTWIGAISKDTSVCFTWGATPFKNIEDAQRADVVVVTIPLALTSALPVDPPLPAWKLEAWARTGRGQAAKLHVPLTAQAPASAVLSVPDGYWTWAATDASGLVQPVAHCFAGSASALERLEVERGSSTWLGRLRVLRPELCLDEELALLTTWADDPWARMAYSAERWSSDSDDPRLMAEPVGRIHFAGEHTAGDWAGLMEGALRSGDRVAQEVLQAMGRPERQGR